MLEPYFHVAGRREKHVAYCVSLLNAVRGAIPEAEALIESAPAPQALYYTILYYYYTILYYTILYYTILYHTIPYHTIPYHTILYYTIL